MKTSMMLIVCIATGVAVAAEEPGTSRAFERPLTKEEARFRALDHDNDRKLSEDEFRADATTQTEFATLDTNHDGFLSMSEFISRPIPPAKTPPPK
jgi:hypothetical protein